MIQGQIRYVILRFAFCLANSIEEERKAKTLLEDERESIRKIHD
jgi:hypothetical protein